MNSSRSDLSHMAPRAQHDRLTELPVTNRARSALTIAPERCLNLGNADRARVQDLTWPLFVRANEILADKIFNDLFQG